MLVLTAPIRLPPVYTVDAFRTVVQTIGGLSDTFEYKNSLDDTPWVALETIAGDNTLKPLTDTNAASPVRFYRVKVGPSSGATP